MMPTTDLPPDFPVKVGTFYLIRAFMYNDTGQVFVSEWGCRNCGAFALVPGPDGIRTQCPCIFPHPVMVYGEM